MLHYLLRCEPKENSPYETPQSIRHNLYATIYTPQSIRHNLYAAIYTPQSIRHNLYATSHRKSSQAGNAFPMPLRDEFSSPIGRIFDPFKCDAAKNHVSFGNFRDVAALHTQIHPKTRRHSKSVTPNQTKSNHFKPFGRPKTGLQSAFARLRPPFQEIFSDPFRPNNPPASSILSFRCLCVDIVPQ